MFRKRSKPRPVEIVRQEWTKVCAEIGVRRVQVANLDHAIAQLLGQARALESEMVQAQERANHDRTEAGRLAAGGLGHHWHPSKDLCERCGRATADILDKQLQCASQGAQ